ncbi:MAG: phosphohydrolase [Phycisphaerales bacterium]|nr:phosphohydrolase [Phycisphaerales bacterium]
MGLLLILSAAADAAVAWFALIPRRRAVGNATVCVNAISYPTAPLTLRRMVTAALVTTTFVAVKCFVLAAAGLEFFGLIHTLYLDCVVVAPLMGLSVLFRARQATLAARIAAVLVLTMIPVGVHASFIEPFRLQTERADIPLAMQRGGREPIVIGVLSDIQTDRVSQYERGAIDRMMASRPDILLLPGDLFEGTDAELERELPAIRELVNRLRAPGGVYFVPGNCESPEQAADILRETGVRLLVNQIVRVNVRDRAVTIAGVELKPTPAAKRTIAELESAPGHDDVRILVSHLPDHVYSMSANSRIDLLVAGHTHGGQVQLPWFGPPIIFSTVPRHVGAGGLHHLDGRRIYVSRGLGVERGPAPRIRFLCPPEITHLTLK